MKHYVITSIGTNPRETTYTLNGKSARGKFSTTALIKLLPEIPDKIIVLATEGAKEKSLEEFKKEVNIDLDVVSIPDGKNKEEVEELLKIMLENIPENSKITLDITGSFRHFSFLFFVAALYLTSLKKVEIENAWYGMFEGKDENGNTPFVNMRIMLDMVEWFYAVKSFVKNPGNTDLSKMFKLTKKRIFKETNNTDVSNYIGKFYKLFQNYNMSYEAGLPLELGKSAKNLEGLIKEWDKSNNYDIPIIPLQEELFDNISKSFENFLIGDENSEDNWKENFILDMDEVKRESKIIDTYMNNEHYSNAIRLMREFLITVCILKNRKNESEPWLEYIHRKPYEDKLNGISFMNQETDLDLPENVKELGKIWDKIAKLRNNIAHNGMSNDYIKIEKNAKKIRTLWESIKEKLDDDYFWKLDADIESEKEGLLITPLGLSPGLLYTALELIRPEKSIIITSEEGKKDIPKIRDFSAYMGDLEIVTISDPHKGFEEIKTRVNNKNIDNWILKADDIIVNLTGGTTVLQYAVELLSRKAERFGKRVTRVAMIDKRSIDEQKRNPFVKGDMVILEKFEEMMEKNGDKNGKN